MSKEKQQIRAYAYPVRLDWCVALPVAALSFFSWTLHAAEEVRPVPQLHYTVQKGLDVRHNPIDRLISTFGFVCVRNPLNPRPCRFEKELVAFLEKMPPNQADISRELTVLGAICQSTIEQLNCVYERHVENSAWLAGSYEPAAVFDEFLRIEMSASGPDGALRYDVTFNRTSQRRPRPTY